MGMSILKDDPMEQSRECVMYIVHQKYLTAKDYLTYNLAMIELNRPFDLNSNVQVAILAKELPKIHATFRAVIAGFRFREINNFYSPTLKSLNVVTKLRGDKKSFIIDAVKRKSNICVGDFGGPMYLNGELIGLSSHLGLKNNYFWKNCFTVDAQFVSIYQFKSWINETIETDLERKRRSMNDGKFKNNCAVPILSLLLIVLLSIIF